MSSSIMELLYFTFFFNGMNFIAITKLFVFQNSILGVVLATQHFGNPLTAAPCAVSSVCHSIFGSVLGGIWRQSAPKQKHN